MKITWNHSFFCCYNFTFLSTLKAIFWWRGINSCLKFQNFRNCSWNFRRLFVRESKRLVCFPFIWATRIKCSFVDFSEKTLLYEFSSLVVEGRSFLNTLWTRQVVPPPKKILAKPLIVSTCREVYRKYISFARMCGF